MKKPVLHLICNAHLDPVWQWRWEEGAAEAITTFGIAARLLREFPSFIFTHNEAILYRWVKEYDPALFEEIRTLVAEQRWCIGGGWDLQPDVIMPGTEALIRHIAEGRRYFLEHFDAKPLVAYNFDPFGHTAGLPQILVKAGYRMYVHMRPEEKNLPLPSDLYRWRGVDGSEIGVYRIPFPAYNTFHNKAVERIHEAAEIALRLNQDTPVFWGLGDHGGGGTRKELEQIQEYMAKETRVEIVHSSTEKYYTAILPLLENAPVVEGELQRIFTGCYTSMSRLKRRMQRNLGELVQTEGLRAATWWLHDHPYPAEELRDAWRDHLFNDFHDILPGSSVETGELDALDLYGRSSETHRRLRLGAAAAFSPGQHLPITIPVTILNSNPGAPAVPVELEYLIDHVPKYGGKWHARLFTLDNKEIPVQEEAAEQLLLVDEWRRKICFTPSLPHVGAAHFRLEMHEGPPQTEKAPPMAAHTTDIHSGLVTNLEAGGGRHTLAGPALLPLVVEDLADSWGMEEWSYRNVAGTFSPVTGSFKTVEDGPVRRITEAAMEYEKSTLLFRTIAYAHHPFLEFRLRIQWNQQRQRLKLAIPTVFRSSDVECEVPGGTQRRPADGQEYVQGRWMIIGGKIGGKPTALAVISSGQHGFDVKGGEIRISVLRSPLYCYQYEYPLEKAHQLKYMDQGVHEMRMLLMAGDPSEVRQTVSGLADWLSAPPYALAHLPVGDRTPPAEELLSTSPGSVRMVACKRSWDGNALVVRLQEVLGEQRQATLHLRQPALSMALAFQPFEIKTIRCERDGTWKEVKLIEEE